MGPGLRPTGWRKIATATWGWPRDPQIYGRLRLEATPLLRAIEALRGRTGAHVTLTHLVVRGMALAEGAGSAGAVQGGTPRFRGSGAASSLTWNPDPSTAWRRAMWSLGHAAAGASGSGRTGRWSIRASAIAPSSPPA